MTLPKLLTIRNFLIADMILLISCLISVAWLAFNSEPQQAPSMPVAANAVASLKQTTTSTKLGMRLIIPKISVDAPVDPVGITTDGALEAPKDPQNAGWYKFGTRPGEKGSAVIDGHYGRWSDGETSVFDNLKKLREGDKIYVRNEGGQTTTFIMRESQIFNPNADATSVFKSSDGHAHLNLITCDGTWNSASKTYTKRLVIFADKQ